MHTSVRPNHLTRARATGATALLVVALAAAAFASVPTASAHVCILETGCSGWDCDSPGTHLHSHRQSLLGLPITCYSVPTQQE